ncbi:MAG: transporter substrate-binding domain-containing protein [Psychrobium sp.]|nr:transporter substrate-binding domain-containing protein [Psychrobium sp.]
MRPVIIILLLVWSMIPTPSWAVEILIASGHVDYPPYAWRDGDKIVGVSVELTTLIFKELGITVDARYVGPWARMQREAKHGKIDFVLGIYKNRQRLQYLTFLPESYERDKVVLFVKKPQSFQYSSWQDLKGKIGSAVIGESFGPDFDSYLADNLHVVRVKNVKQSLRMTHIGRVDYTIVGLYTGLAKSLELGLSKDLTALSQVVSNPKAYQAFTKQSKFVKHLSYFNKRIQQLKADGTIDKLVLKHWNIFMQQKSANTKNH